MKFEINPYIGVEPILLGMSSKQIQDALGILPTKFKKFNDDEMYTDAFKCFYVYYKNSGESEAIEFFEPATVIFRGQSLISAPYIEIKNWFQSIDNSIEIDGTGFVSFKYGIGVYAPFAEDEPYEPIEGVIIFEKGYYDD